MLWNCISCQQGWGKWWWWCFSSWIRPTHHWVQEKSRRQMQKLVRRASSHATIPKAHRQGCLREDGRAPPKNLGTCCGCSWSCCHLGSLLFLQGNMDQQKHPSDAGNWNETTWSGRTVSIRHGYQKHHEPIDNIWGQQTVAVSYRLNNQMIEHVY